MQMKPQANFYITVHRLTNGKKELFITNGKGNYFFIEFY